MRTAGTMSDDQSERTGASVRPRRRHPAEPAEFPSEGAASMRGRRQRRGRDERNEAQTEGPNAAVEKIERGMALSHVEQG